MIRRTMYALAVRDLQASAAYYRDVLGFAVREIGDDGWRMFERDGCRITAGHCPDATPASELGDHSYFAYLVVDDAKGFRAEVVGNGADVTKSLRDEPWSVRESGVRTNDGHRSDQDGS